MMPLYLPLVFNISVSHWDKRTFGSPQRRCYLICAFIGVFSAACLVSAVFISLISSVSLFSLYLIFSSAVLVLPIPEPVSFILSLTLFHPLIKSFVVCVIVYFWHKKGLHFSISALLFLLYSSSYFCEIKTMKEKWGTKEREKRKKARK